MAFINIDINTSSDAALTAFVDKMQEHFPNWEGADGDLLLWFATWVSQEYPDLASLTAEMSALAFRRFGEEILGVPPLPATAATATTTWTMIDTDGHTIPEGTQVQIADGDDLYGFATTAEIVVANGESVTAAGEVAIQALVSGEEANGLTSDPTLIDALSFVASIELVTDTTGGEAEEAEDVFLSRLKDEFKLLSKVLILPSDVATATRRVAGVARATVIDNLDPGTNEVQTVTVNGAPTGGSYTVKLGAGGDPSDAIAFDATAAAFKAALVDGSTDFGTVDVDVSGAAGGPYTITFKGQYASTNVSALALGTNSLTGGTTPAPAFATTTAGAAAATGQEKTVAVFAIDEDGADAGADVKTAIVDELTPRRETGFIFHVADPTRTQIKVSVTAVALDGFDEAGLEASIEEVLAEYLSPSNWGASPTDDSDTGVWINQTVVRRFELISLIDRVEGLDYVSALELAEESDALGTADVTLNGYAALPEPGTITVTVT